MSVTTRRADPAKMIPGEPLAVLRVGPVYSESGEELPGNVTDVQQLHDMVTCFERTQKPYGDWPKIDFEHKGVGPLAVLVPASIEERLPLGIVADMRVEGDALIATPAWTKRGRALLDAAEGIWDPSATYLVDTPVHDRHTNEHISNAKLKAFSVTLDPATRPDVLGAIRSVLATQIQINQDVPPHRAAPVSTEEGPMSPDEILAAINALDAEGLAAVKAGLGGDEPEARMNDDEYRASAEANEASLRSANEALAGKVNDLTGRLEAIEKSARVAIRSTVLDKLAPAMRGPAGDVFDAEPNTAKAEERVLYAFRSHVINTGSVGAGADGGEQAKQGPEPTRNGFVVYARNNKQEGESNADALRRVRKEFPALAAKAFPGVN